MVKSKDIKYMLFVTADGRAQVLKRDYNSLTMEMDGFFNTDDLKWMDENSHNIDDHSCFVPEGKKEIMFKTTSGRETTMKLRDLYTRELVHVFNMTLGERLKSFKFI